MYMKKTWMFAALAGAMALVGCGGKKSGAPVAEIVADTVAVADEALYGTCGDGTSMHSLQLLVGGDTLTLALSAGDDVADVQGGMAVGDSMTVATMGGRGKGDVVKVVNVSSLMGRWASLDHQFALLPGGRVEGSLREPHAYTRWQLVNCRLVLPPDTFDVSVLGPDSLYLVRGGERWGYRRMK